jgi:sphingoid base N-palmitoyltransferase
MAHHVATIGLVLYSWQVNFSRVGAMTFLCHDANDVFLEGAKLARYARRQGLATGLFAAFAGSWFVTRLFYFPLWIIWTAWHDPAPRIALPYGVDPDPHFLAFQSMLFFLLALHAYWSYLILKVLAKALKGKVEDVREDDSSDSD